METCIIMLKKEPPGDNVQCSECKKNFFLARNMRISDKIVPKYMCSECFLKLDRGQK